MIELTDRERKLLDRLESPRSRTTAWLLLAAAVVCGVAAVSVAVLLDRRMRYALELDSGPAADAAYERALEDLDDAGLLDEAILIGDVERRLDSYLSLYAGWACAFITLGGVTVAIQLLLAGLSLLEIGPGAARDRLILKLHAASEERAADGSVPDA